MADSIESLQKIIIEYEKILGIGEHDPMKNAFIIYVKILNQQSDYLQDFKIKEKIDGKKSESAEYDRAMEMIKGLPKMINDVNDLKSVLKLSKEDLAELRPNNPVFAKITTPETMADSIGEHAGVKN